MYRGGCRRGGRIPKVVLPVVHWTRNMFVVVPVSGVHSVVAALLGTSTIMIYMRAAENRLVEH